MKKTLQYKYDDLFGEGWRPPVQSRDDLMTWACMQQNSFMTEKGAPEELLWNCDNPRGLIARYGPNYDAVKAKLGYIRGLHRE